MNTFDWIVTYLLAALLGLAVGSYLNVVIYRLPLGMSTAKPPSHCPRCQYRLKPYDNIPVLSYLFLGGKCRNCGEKISFRYTAVELVNGLLWVSCVWLFWEKSIALACINAAVSSIFICVFWIDLEHKVIFDRFHVMLLLLGIITVFLDSEYGWLSHLLGGVLGFGILFLLGLVFEKIYGEEALGGGDIKLTGAVGLLLGWERLLLAILLSSLSAAVIMLVIRLVRKEADEKTEEGADEREDSYVEKHALPFAPFLVTGFLVSLYFGNEILRAYLSLFAL